MLAGNYCTTVILSQLLSSALVCVGYIILPAHIIKVMYPLRSVLIFIQAVVTLEFFKVQGSISDIPLNLSHTYKTDLRITHW